MVLFWSCVCVCDLFLFLQTVRVNPASARPAAGACAPCVFPDNDDIRVSPNPASRSL